MAPTSYRPSSNRLKQLSDDPLKPTHTHQKSTRPDLRKPKFSQDFERGVVPQVEAHFLRLETVSYNILLP